MLVKTLAIVGKAGGATSPIAGLDEGKLLRGKLNEADAPPRGGGVVAERGVEDNAVQRRDLPRQGLPQGSDGTDASNTGLSPLRSIDVMPVQSRRK